MISVTDLLEDDRIPSNYFATDAYVRGDVELGILENRQGDRLIALPETLIQGIYAGLENETGQAAWLVLFNCGRWWGKNFYTRFQEAISGYYNKPLSEMLMVEFLQALQQCWMTHGWGKIELDQSYQQQGFLIIRVWHSPFARFALKPDRPNCHLEAGILASFFSQLARRELHCVQTTCESMNADCNRFVLGLHRRLEPVEPLVTKLDHEAIMQRLCQ